MAGAVQAFESAAFGGGPAVAPTTGSADEALRGVVSSTVDECGLQVVFEIADQYPSPLREAVVDGGLFALGEIVSVPAGMLCRQLSDIGFTAKNAVDYWYLHESPPNMDADLDGVPCETVWPEAGQYVPAWY